jgi:hypothetical protein
MYVLLTLLQFLRPLKTFAAESFILVGLFAHALCLSVLSSPFLFKEKFEVKVNAANWFGVASPC